MEELEYFEANGLRFAAFDEGEGPLVVLLHGFPDTAHTWDAVRPALVEAGYRAVSPFMRGYAPTEVPDEKPTAEALARDVIGLIEACGEESAVVVGHDWGAFTAYAAAALQPERISRLFCVAIPHPAAVGLRPRLLWKARHFFKFNLPGAARRLRRNDFAYVDKLYRRWSPDWDVDEEELAPVKESLRQPGSAEAAIHYYHMFRRPPSNLFRRRRIEVPTAVVAALDEDFLPTSIYEDARHLFKDDYEVIALPGGHFAHREHPEKFNEALVEWLGNAET